MLAAGVIAGILAFAWAPFVVVDQPLLACGLLLLLAVARRLLGETPAAEALVGVGVGVGPIIASGAHRASLGSAA
jgi:hypothetical protein